MSRHHMTAEGKIPFTEQEELEADAREAQILLQDAEKAKFSYIEKRKSEYPDFRDYLDGVVKNDQAQIQAYIDACLAVKAKYPKP